jgi:Fur family ferric uptake transcriptional regulator
MTRLAPATPTEATTLTTLATQIRSAGARATPARIRVLQILRTAPAALTHHDIDLALGTPTLDRVTLYRVLDWLVEAGLAHKSTDARGVFRFSVAAAGDQQRASIRLDHCRQASLTEAQRAPADWSKNRSSPGRIERAGNKGRRTCRAVTFANQRLIRSDPGCSGHAADQQLSTFIDQFAQEREDRLLSRWRWIAVGSHAFNQPANSRAGKVNFNATIEGSGCQRVNERRNKKLRVFRRGCPDQEGHTFRPACRAFSLQKWPLAQ